MGRAEVGTPKYLANKMKAKGLQRLRWYCQVCEKQCRDENGFKCHTQSESHVRNMLLVGENAHKSIEQYSRQFQHDFLHLLRTGHGEKPINANRFYQEYIMNKEHIHMNATKWTSLTEFVQYLGKNGLCKVTEDEKNGVMIAYIDKSPEALQRQEALRKKQRLDNDDEQQRQILLNQQIAKAKENIKNNQSIEKDIPDIKPDDILKPDDIGKVNLQLNKTSNQIKPLKNNSKANSLKKNIFKQSSTENKISKPSSKPLSALQRIMINEQRKH